MLGDWICRSAYPTRQAAFIGNTAFRVYHYYTIISVCERKIPTFASASRGDRLRMEAEEGLLVAEGNVPDWRCTNPTNRIK